MPGPHIALMLKAPRPGLVKTRLARELSGGDAEAAVVYRKLVEHQWAQLPEQWSREIHFAPADAVADFQAWLPGAAGYFPQPNGDLGTRLMAAVDGAFSRGASAVFLIGGDCPGLTHKHFVWANEQLNAGRDYVIGPASDGGYTLLGLKARLPALFTEMPWSTPDVGRLTIERATQAGWRGSQLETLEDVDDLASWQRQAHLINDARANENRA